MKKILVTGFTSNRGGIETFAMNYIRAIHAIDNSLQFDVLSCDKEPAFADEIWQCEGAVYTILPPSKPGYHHTLRRFFKKHGADYEVLWCNKCDLANIDYLKEATRVGIPKRIIHSHNSENMYSGWKGKLHQTMHRLHQSTVSRYATDFWACSDYAAKWLFGKTAEQDPKIQYIPNAIRTEQFAFNEGVRKQYRKELQVEGYTVYGCVGRLSYAKNPEFTIELFDSIWKRDKNSVLLMVGDGELREAIKARARSKPCAGNVRFLGLRNDVPQLLQAMDCYLMPSRLEGLPVAAIEAQAAGLPVFLASDGITRQVALTPLCHFLPLSLGPAGWAKEILRAALSRHDYNRDIQTKGFELSTAAEKLKNRIVDEGIACLK